MNPGAAAEGPASIGAYLERQRRMRGVSVDDLAALTKIPKRSLERLESGVFDSEPDGFVRGFVRTVAEALGLDPDETVMRLLDEPADDALAEAARARRMRRSVLIGAAAVLGVVALALVLWWVGGSLLSEAPVVTPAADQVEPRVFRKDAVRDLAEGESRGPGP